MNNNYTTPEDREEQVYMEPAGAWNRTASVVLDWFILLPLTLGFSLYSLLVAKSWELSLMSPAITLMYKVWMEHTFGATLGKQIAGVRVVDYAGQPISWSQAFTRSWFFLFSFILSCFQNMELYSIPAVQEAGDLQELIQALQQQGEGMNTVLQNVSTLILLAALVDVLFMLMEEHKRTLHDLWAKTLVIRR